MVEAKNTQPTYDVFLQVLLFVIVFVGLAILFDTSYVKGISQVTKMPDEFKKQLIALTAGVACYFLFSRFNYRFWVNNSSIWLWLSLFLCVGVFTSFLGVEMNGAHRWINTRIPGFNFQPSEATKLAVVLFLANWLPRYVNTGAPKPRATAGVFVKYPWIVPTVLIFSLMVLIEREPDLGTAMIIGAITLGLMYVSGVKKRYILTVLICAVVLGTAVLALAQHRNHRIPAWLDPWKYYETSGYQACRSYLGVGTGGWFGVGIGEGREKRFLPAATTDYVFVTVAEETGLVGSVILISIIGLIVWRCFIIGMQCKDQSGALIAKGIGFWIGSQAFMNIGVSSGLLPSVGVPLPFISYGGSSCVILLIAMGITQSVAKFGNIKEVTPPNENDYNRRGYRRTYDASDKRRLSRVKLYN